MGKWGDPPGSSFDGAASRAAQLIDATPLVPNRGLAGISKARPQFELLTGLCGIHRRPSAVPLRFPNASGCGHSSAFANLTVSLPTRRQMQLFPASIL